MSVWKTRKVIADYEHELRKAFERGDTLIQMSKAFGFAPESLCNWFRHTLGQKAVLMRGRKTRRRSDEIVARYKAGETASAIAKELNVHVNTICTELRRVLGHVPSQHRPTILKHRWKEVAEMYRTGKYSMKKLAAHFGCSKPAIAWCLRRCLSTEEIRAIAPHTRQSGKRHKNWRGGRTTTRDGHILITLDNGIRVSEHRQIAETVLGRTLIDGEQVHHANGQPGDNRQQNLVVCDSRSVHHALHGWLYRKLGETHEALFLELHRQFATERGGITILADLPSPPENLSQPSESMLF